MGYVDPARRPVGIFCSYVFVLIILARLFSFATGISVRGSGWGFVGIMLILCSVAGAATWLTLRLPSRET